MIRGLQDKGSKVAVLAGFVLAWLAAGLHTLEACDESKPSPASIQASTGFFAESKEHSSQSQHNSRTCSICSSGVVAFADKDEAVVLHVLESGFVLTSPQLLVSYPFPVATLARGPPIL